MINVVIGIALLIVTAVLYIWIPSKEEQPSRPAKRGTATLLPLAITCLGIAGLALIAKGAIS